MRDCVRRFAEAMDAMLTEKENAGCHLADEFIKDSSLEYLLTSMRDQATGVVDLRALIHTANYAMAAWNKVKIHG